MTLRIGTLNCNGLRGAHKKNLSQLLQTANCDILMLQEIRTSLNFDHAPFLSSEYNIIANPAHKPGYSGTLIATRASFSEYAPSFSWDALPLCSEGRLIDYYIRPHVRLINFYWPSGGEPARQASKIEFLKALQKIELSPSDFLIIGGDFNIAATDLDLKNWKGNKEQPGCTTEERELFKLWMKKNNLIDTYRDLHSHAEPEEYSWWSYRHKAFEKNIGWRIDTIFLSQAHSNLCQKYGFISEPRCSDHALYWIDLNLNLE